MKLKEQLETKEELLEHMYVHLERVPKGSINHYKWEIALLEKEIEKIRNEYIKKQVKKGIIYGSIAFGIAVGLLHLTSYLT